MTLQQEAYSRIDQMTDDGIKVLIDIIDKMKTDSVVGFKNVESTNAVPQAENVMSRSEKKRRFMESAGKIKVDAAAVNELRERSLI
mgnify:CR=1 FL=1